MDEPLAREDAGSSAPITACIIARDEAACIADCLASVSFCREILLVDSGSTDATVEIARAAGARILEHEWMGYAIQRNIAIDHAHGDWVLEIDADERVSEQLRGEIEAFVAATPEGVDLAGMPHREYLLGHWLGPSAKYPKYRHRLFRRGAYRHDESRLVHEGLVPHGPVTPFAGDLVHLLATSWREVFLDAWRYARLEAGQMNARRTPAAVLSGAFARPLAKLLYRLFVDGGWRDGWPGLTKIASDCGIDSVVWMRYALGRRGEIRGDSGVPEELHYGAWKARRGSLRVIGVAAAGEAGPAARWLEGAARGGADVALIAPATASGAALRVRPVQRMRPLALCRALDAEEQLRTIDAVVPFGARARLALALVPAGLRGHMSGLSGDQDPRSRSWDERARAGAPGT